MRTLLDHGANPHTKNAENQTSLELALESDEPKGIIQLLTEHGAKLNNECLFRASDVVIIDAIALLLKAGADIEWKGSEAETPLIAAARGSRSAIVPKLIQQGANIDAKRFDGNAALSVAASEGHTDILRILLDNGANLENKAHKQDTALLRASLGKPAVMQILLEQGANVEARRDDDATPLFVAAEHGHTKIVKRLLNSGADIECTAHNFKYTPLLIAAIRGQATTIELLLNKGANIEASNTGGLTALQEAAKHHRTKIVSMLLLRGANMESMDKGSDFPDYELHQCFGFTPLLFAASRNHRVTTK